MPKHIGLAFSDRSRLHVQTNVIQHKEKNYLLAQADIRIQ